VTGRRGPRLRLLVGNAVAFEIGRDRIGVGLHLPSIPESSDAVADGGKEDFQYARLDGGVTRWFSIQGFIAKQNHLRHAAMHFVDMMAHAYRKCPFARFHLPSTLEAVSEALGVALPKPAHVASAP